MKRRQLFRGIAISSLTIFAGCSKSNDDAPASPAPATSEPSPQLTKQATPIHGSYETTDITVQSPTGEPLGSLTAAIADTDELRYEGLSSTLSLPRDRGMLFVYEEPQGHAFVMHEMDFGLDIIFVDGERTISRIHHAEEPGPDEDDQLYTGWGQYVLEVNLDWTTERGITQGDSLKFTL